MFVDTAWISDVSVNERGLGSDGGGGAKLWWWGGLDFPHLIVIFIIVVVNITLHQILI